MAMQRNCSQVLFPARDSDVFSSILSLSLESRPELPWGGGGGGDHCFFPLQGPFHTLYYPPKSNTFTVFMGPVLTFQVLAML